MRDIIRRYGTDSDMIKLRYRLLPNHVLCLNYFFSGKEASCLRDELNLNDVQIKKMRDVFNQTGVRFPEVMLMIILLINQ